MQNIGELLMEHFNKLKVTLTQNVCFMIFVFVIDLKSMTVDQWSDVGFVT